MKRSLEASPSPPPAYQPLVYNPIAKLNLNLKSKPSLGLSQGSEPEQAKWLTNLAPGRVPCQLQVPAKRASETSLSSPPTYQPLVYSTNTNTNANDSSYTNADFRYNSSLGYITRVLPAPAQWQGRTWNSNSNSKTYAQRFRERVAVFQDAENTEKNEGKDEQKKVEKKLSSPFESDLERTEHEQDDDSQWDTDSQATKVDEDDEMLLLPEKNPLKKLWIENFEPKPKPKHQRQCQSQALPPQPRNPCWSTTESHTPLSNDAISKILLECRPLSPRAKSWAVEHKANKAASARMRAVNLRGNFSERDELRRRVLQLRPKNEWNIWRSREGGGVGVDVKGKDKDQDKGGWRVKTETTQVAVAHDKETLLVEGEKQRYEEARPRPCPIVLDDDLDPRENDKFQAGYRKYDGPAKFLKEKDRMIYRAMKTSSRLQYLVCDHEAPEDMSQRVKAELRNFFVTPHETRQRLSDEFC
ncbi:hypothetical protein BDV06DRAFT_221826 [Aspergillus oleicola]